MLRRERMDQIARSTAARGLLSAAAVALALALNGGLLAAVAGQVVARLAVLLFHDRPKATSGRIAGAFRDGRAGRHRAHGAAAGPGDDAGLALRQPAPLCHRARLGTLELGAFAAVTSFQTVGSTVINALGQAAMPRLARYFSAGEARQFRGLAARPPG